MKTSNKHLKLKRKPNKIDRFIANIAYRCICAVEWFYKKHSNVVHIEQTYRQFKEICEEILKHKQ